MGLDTVELILNVEEVFDINIQDSDAEHLQTAGDLYSYVVQQTTLSKAGTCLTAAAFYDVRTALKHLGITKRFGPSCALKDVLPRQNTRQFWDRLSIELRSTLPALVRPRWLVRVLSLTTVFLSRSIAYLTMGQQHRELYFFLNLMLAMLTIGYALSIFSAPMATVFDESFDSFRKLSERILALNRTKYVNKYAGMGQNDIWVILREIIADTLNMDHDEIRPESNFVSDLGCD